MATHHNSRPSTLKRPLPAHARPSKPAHSSKRSTSSVVSKKVARPQEDESDDDTSMATSFLQYCTTCEKQIVTPSNFVLYCSESCRKQDNDKQLPHPAEYTPPMTPYTGFTSEDLQFRDIVPPRSPTAPSKRSSCTFSEMSSDDNANSNDEKPRLERTDSEAWRYLRQFRSPTAANAETTVRPGRPRYNRASTAQASFYTNTAPSLSHSHSSSISLSMPYTPSTRPLQPRTNPHTSSYGTRSADLVTPLTSTTAPSTPPQYSLKSAPLLATSKGNVEGEMMLYEKSPIPTVVSADGSLKQLFAASPR